LEGFRALKLSKCEKTRALYFSRLEKLKALKPYSQIGAFKALKTFQTGEF
jgi:hypothetical protein